jgi:hypothetical protein
LECEKCDAATESETPIGEAASRIIEVFVKNMLQFRDEIGQRLKKDKGAIFCGQDAIDVAQPSRLSV